MPIFFPINNRKMIFSDMRNSTTRYRATKSRFVRHKISVAIVGSFQHRGTVYFVGSLELNFFEVTRRQASESLLRG